MPTCDFSSPTTTSAVNEKRRPPFTTLATRLISTTRSCRSEPSPRPPRVLSLLAMRTTHRSDHDSIRRPVHFRARRRRAPSRGRGSGSRRGRRPRSRPPPPWRARRAARPRAWPGPSTSATSGRPRSSSPPPACGRPRRRSPGPGYPGSSGTRTGADARRCRAPWRARDGGGAASIESSCRGSCALTDLPGHVLALVADALALVGLRRALLADDRRHLAHGLLGDAADDDARGHRDLEVDSLGSLELDRVRVAERQHELLALELCAVADALDLEALLEAVRHALDHVRNQAAGEAVERAVLAAVGRALDEDLAVLLLHADVAVLAL